MPDERPPDRPTVPDAPARETDGDAELLLYRGESPQDRRAFVRYLIELERGKSLLQLQAAADSITDDIRQSWHARTFTPVRTSIGVFDEVVCNIAYHFNKHGQGYGSIRKMTDAALINRLKHHNSARYETASGLWRTPDNSLYMSDGKIVTYVGRPAQAKKKT